MTEREMCPRPSPPTGPSLAAVNGIQPQLPAPGAYSSSSAFPASPFNSRTFPAVHGSDYSGYAHPLPPLRSISSRKSVHHQLKQCLRLNPAYRHRLTVFLPLDQVPQPLVRFWIRLITLFRLFPLICSILAIQAILRLTDPA